MPGEARAVPVLLAAIVSALSGCVSLGADDKPTYASDSAFTRPWATCLVTNAEEKDDGASQAWVVAQAVAEECAPDLLSAFRRETNEKDRRKAYSLTAEKAEALILGNRRDRANGIAPMSAGMDAARAQAPGAYGMGM